MSARMRVYCAVSLDGFLAGASDELDWLGVPDVVDEATGQARLFPMLER